MQPFRKGQGSLMSVIPIITYIQPKDLLAAEEPLKNKASKLLHFLKL